ncbi:MAG TPA: hypothetical protein VFI69_03180 [Candidatus Limnocylindrales bacterium]|jgi:hypothetical protein|nr:hypothetical protein [Candidatus Limnocylindrales bacterium]
MTGPDRTYDPIRFQRGTRGFAAFLTGLNGAVVLGATLFVVPTLGLDQITASWAVILGLLAGIGHLVAIVGLIRGRRWGAGLVAYLAAAGVAIAGFGALASATGLEVFGADRATAFGFFAWMIGAWLVATRFALRPFSFTPHAHRPMARVPAPLPDVRPQTGARKARLRQPLAIRPVGMPRSALPSPSRIVLYPITTPTA